MRHLLLKRTFAAVLSCAVFLSGVPSAFAEIAEETNTESGVRLISMDFESDTHIFDWSRNGLESETVSEEMGQSLLVAPVGSTNLFYKKFTPAEGGIMGVSFDYRSDRAPEDTNQIYISILNSEFATENRANDVNKYHSLFISNEFHHTQEVSSRFKWAEPKMAVEAGRWYEISLWFDLVNHIAYYMVDGELFSQVGISDTLESIGGIMVSCEGTAPVKTYIDNLSVTHFQNEIQVLDESKRGTTVPPSMAREVDVVMDLGQLGNIYYTKDKQTATLKLRNKTDQNKKISVKYTLTHEGRLGEPETKEISIAPFEDKTVSIDFHGTRYGYYTVKTEVFDTDGKLIISLDPVRYSVVNAPPEGVHNKKVGTNIPIRPSNSNITDVMNWVQLAERIGISLYRVEVAMGQYNVDHAPGETGLLEDHQTLFKFFKEKGLTPTMTLGFGSPLDPNYNDVLNKYAVALINDPMVNSVTNQYALLNEPDLSFRGWPAERYVEILKSLYPAMKAADPDAFLWGPTTAGRSGPWVDKFFEEGGGNYVDGLDTHGYSHKSTPEGGGIISSLQSFKENMEKHGVGDKPLYFSEYGWTNVGENGYSDTNQQSYYNIRLCILNDYYGLWDQASQYSFHDSGLNNEQEMRFGMVKHPATEIPYEAKPIYLTYGNYNALMNEAEFIERVELSSDVALYRYRLADGRDCIVTWSISGKANVSVNLDTDKVDLYDSFGNAEELYGISGDFFLSLTEEPIYLIGDFDKAAKGTRSITADKNETSIVSGDCGDIVISKSFDDDLKIELLLPDNLTAEKNEGFKGSSAQVILRSKTLGEENEKAVVYVKKNGKTIYRTQLYTNYSDAVEIEVYSKPYDANQLNHWQSVFTVKSNAYSSTNSGVIKFKAPEILRDRVGTVKIPQISPGESKTIKINLPQSLNGQEFNLLADIEMEVGGTIPIDCKVTSDVCIYANEKPTIDGVLDKGEWNKKTRIKMNDRGVSGDTFVTLMNDSVFGGNEDLSANLYTMWDEKNLYVALEVTDDVYEYDRTDGIYWASDGIQLCLAPSQESKDVMGFGFGMVGDKKVIELEVTPNNLFVGPLEGDLCVTRNENITTYELCVPWSQLYPMTDYSPRANKPLAFSILINDNDGTGRHGYLEYGAGVGKGGKNPELFRDIFILGKK